MLLQTKYWYPIEYEIFCFLLAELQKNTWVNMFGEIQRECNKPSEKTVYILWFQFLRSLKNPGGM